MDDSPQTTTSSLQFNTSSANTMSVADDVKSQHRQLFNPVTPDISPPLQLGKGGSSMKSTRTQEVMDSSYVTSADIQEMEQVRQHLHIMLQNCKGFSDQPDYNQAPSSTTDYETQDNDGDIESMASVDTTALLARLLPNSSPLSELQMHVQNAERSIITSHDQSARQTGSLPTERRLRTIPSSKVAGDRTLMTENSLLRDHLEKEQFRRKHCEQQIQDLHGKLLEVQQQLAVAVSAERKKDAMIEQLDKTLAKVVEGWKKHESEKLTIIDQLKEERGTAEQSHQRQEEMLLQFEKELAQAVEALTREQERARQAESEKQTQLQQQKEERSKLLELLSKEKENVLRIETEKNQIIKESEQAQQKYMEADASLKQQMKIAEELQEKVTSLEEEHSLALVKEKEKLDHEKQTVQDVQVVLMSVQKEVKRLEIELDTANREKESVRMELHLMEAKHEANRTKEETERQSELEREMTKRLEEIQEKMSKAETEMRDSHRKQIQEMNKKHKEDLEQQLAKFHEELKRKDVKLKSVSEEYEERITDCQEKMASLANIRQHVENERQIITVRLQQMMKSHCEEAIKLLNSSTTKLPPLSETRQLSDVHGNFLNGTTETSLKWAKEDAHHLDKVPIPAAKSLYPPLQPQQQQQQQPKLPSSVFPLFKPTYNTTQGSSGIGSGVFSGSYSHTNGDAGKHGILFHDQSSLEFHPLHAVVDSDSSIITGQSHVATTLTRAGASTGTDNSPKSVAMGNVTDANLMEQDLDVLEPDTTLCSEFPHEQNEETLRQTSPTISNDISERLQQQESRQAELNHYVKMLLQRSPGDHSFEEQDHLSQGLMLIPSSSEARDGYGSSGVISPIQSDHQLEQQYVTASRNPHTSFGAVTTDHFCQDDKHKGTSAQVAFTKTTVPTASISVTSSQGFDSWGQALTQKPHSRFSQVAPHTPPRREKDIDDQLPPPGALTPQQVGQLSRMLGMFSEHGNQPITTEELFAYLRGVQNTQATDAVSTWSQQQQNLAVAKISAPGPSLRQVGANRAKRSLDTNFQKRQDQLPQTQGPSVNGRPIHATAGQISKPTEQAAQVKSHGKQPTKLPLSNGMGPPLRYPTVQEAVKPAAKPGVQSKEKKVVPGGKQAKASAWR